MAGAALLVACSDDDRSGPTTEPGPPERLAYPYGAEALQVADLYLPSRSGGRTAPPVVVLVHGGYWQAGFDRAVMAPLVAPLTASGWAVWNIDYRVVGHGGGWPATYQDTAAAIDHLTVAATEHPLALDRVVAVGHSAGATLALAGLDDLAACAEAVGGDGCVAFMGAEPGSMTATSWRSRRPACPSVARSWWCTAGPTRW